MQHDFIRGLPKAELHLHIEGSLEPEQMFEFARRNRIALPFKSVEAVRAAYAFSNLQDFLDIYYQGAGVLQTEEDFRDLAMAYFRRAAADGTVHAEIFFDPQTHTERGIPFAVAADGLLAGMAQAQRELGVTSKLILSYLRHLSEEDAFKTLREAEPYLDRIVGVGLDSSELGHPPNKFARVFKASRERGLKLSAHAGEEGPPEYVWEALDGLAVDRIDHGNRSLEDAVLVKRLVADGMTLTVCPLSNLKLCVVDDLANHTLKRMLDLGLKATINSDDPAYFGGYIGENWTATTAALGLSRDELATLARNSFTGSFLAPAEIASRVAEVDAYMAGN
ncbi:MAG: adenosine deaminase [Phenylobacterium sp.]|uniref:adenosine deaminase n=1 Tax=Phenylobacterium sp. TaxID=1871053 RepID=UPI001B6DC8FC|nr:adenosine deaminase [Phenylobacterium sp.]MBP7814808.1 adenosine deaminase [Phenylobacterium sp.]MBP9232697.1 adenosine deaminase [Phenylobacterium sp.]MBP9754396.1 adenosine deaminase [Phenylobacterium sp.]